MINFTLFLFVFAFKKKKTQVLLFHLLFTLRKWTLRSIGNRTTTTKEGQDCKEAHCYAF